jgi:hypothetical protein
MVAELRATISKLSRCENRGHWKSKVKYPACQHSNFGFQPAVSIAYPQVARGVQRFTEKILARFNPVAEQSYLNLSLRLVNTCPVSRVLHTGQR